MFISSKLLWNMFYEDMIGNLNSGRFERKVSLKRAFTSWVDVDDSIRPCQGEIPKAQSKVHSHFETYKSTTRIFLHLTKTWTIIFRNAICFQLKNTTYKKSEKNKQINPNVVKGPLSSPSDVFLESVLVSQAYFFRSSRLIKTKEKNQRTTTHTHTQNALQ